ncbi:MAG TPA: hypothetical protein VGR62_11365 [Candidatus Binatia bacterium]|jgi:hypothetical protein|nr:hypothetical protein [Candidatus Binatia bacterium]
MTTTDPRETHDMTTELNGAVSAIADQAAEHLEDVRGEIETVDRRVRDIVDEYPLAAIVGAVAVGYLVARLTSRI